MTLKQKFQDVQDAYHDRSDDCVVVADEFAIEFVKFIETDKNVRYVGCVIENGEEKQYSYNRKYYTTKQLLEIFKNQKEL